MLAVAAREYSIEQGTPCCADDEDKYTDINILDVFNLFVFDMKVRGIIYNILLGRVADLDFLF